MEYNIPKMPERPLNANKGTLGKILNIAGSKYMSGAAYLSSISALKAGAGYVELLSCDEALRAVANLAPEIVLAPAEELNNIIKTATVISIGCGLSTSNEAVKLFKDTLALKNKQPLLIDADGLNILSNNYTELDKNTILTPHPKEAARLLNCTLEEILQNVYNSAKEIADKYNCVAVLKTHNTVVCDGENFYTNKTPCPALSKAGSGDVLCGIISGLSAQKMKSFDAAVLGVYLHNQAGILAANELTEYGVLASDLVKYIPYAIKNHLC